MNIFDKIWQLPQFRNYSIENISMIINFKVNIFVESKVSLCFDFQA